MPSSYILITAARNEESYIEKTIRAVVAQTIRPEKWVIVNDSSRDRTEEIVSHYSSKYNFIHLLNKKSNNIRNFASKVDAIHAGLKSLVREEYRFVGNLDADIEIGPDYFQRLVGKFNENDKLGIAGGWIYEFRNGQYRERIGNSEHSVPGSVQIFRRECFDAIGNFLPIKTGGEDCIAEVMARMNGWSTQSFPDLKVFHIRVTHREETNLLGASYRLGKEDYFVGNHPLFELLKCLRRIQARPFSIAGVFRFFGYIGGLISTEPILVPRDVIEYLRKEQVNRIKALIKKRKLIQP